jgi:thioredoxin reductase
VGTAVAAANQAPTVSAAVSLITSEDTLGASVDLLANASDVDATDILSVTNLTEISGNDAGGVSLPCYPKLVDTLYS